MKLVNHKFIQLDKMDIFHEFVKLSDDNNSKKLEFFQKVFDTLSDYEKEYREMINTLYISIDNLTDTTLIKISDLPIERQRLLNATLFAIYNQDFEIVSKLTPFFIKKEVLPYELGNALDYVLDHSLDMNEYLEVERKKFIYFENDNKIERGYLFTDKDRMVKKLELK